MRYMRPEVWGPLAWTLLHSVAASAPVSLTVTQFNHYKRFYESLAVLLPCGTCRINYGVWLENHPFTGVPHTQSGIKNWVLDLHNDVNRRYGKSPWTMAQLNRTYIDDDGKLIFSHAKAFKFIDIVVTEADGSDANSKLPESERVEQYLIFFRALAEVFPCVACRKRLKKLLGGDTGNGSDRLSTVTTIAELKAWYASIKDEWQATHRLIGEQVYLTYKSADGKPMFRQIHITGLRNASVNASSHRMRFIFANDTERFVPLPAEMPAGDKTIISGTELNFIKAATAAVAGVS